MIRCSCHGLHGCVPIAPSPMPSGSASSSSWRAALERRGRRLGERLAAAGADLDLGGDQLADEVRLELGAAGRGLQLLEAVDEPERHRVEDGELLLDRDA